jgi:hypothetical protein
MVYDINIHELNLEPFRDLKFLDEISFKTCVAFAFLNNEYIIIYNNNNNNNNNDNFLNFFIKKKYYNIKEEEIL